VAPEKTGEMHVVGRLYGAHTGGDFERCQEAVFVGKNPWQSQSFAQARKVLRDIERDERQAMIVLDPVRT